MGAIISAPLTMMGSCCGSLAGSCIANMCCKACSCACVAPIKLTSFLYLGLLVAMSILALILRENHGDWVIGGSYIPSTIIPTNDRFSCAKDHSGGFIICCASQCGGVFAVYRISFVLCLFFSFLMLLTMCTSKFAARAHRGFWFPKLFLIVLLLFSTIFVDNSAMQAYRSVAMWASAIFLALQTVLLIDFGYKMNEWLVELDEKYDIESPYCNFKMLILALSTGLFALSITLWSLTGVWFAQDGCAAGQSQLALVVILTVFLTAVSCTKIAPHGTILTSSIITCYASYLCYSAFRSKPADGSACNPFDKAVYPWQDLFMGIVIYTISMATTAYSASGMESATVVGKTSDSSGTVANDALTVTLDDGSNGNSDGTKKAADDDEDAPVGKEQWYSYHFMMVVSAFYMAMLLSDWSTQGLTEGPEKSLSISIESFWVKILSMWACLLLYGWTLLAPYLLRNYREFPGIDFD